MRPVRLVYYLLFVGIEMVAVLGALLGIVFLFVPFVALKTAWVLVSGGRRKATSSGQPT